MSEQEPEKPKTQIDWSFISLALVIILALITFLFAIVERNSAIIRLLPFVTVICIAGVCFVVIKSIFK